MALTKVSTDGVKDDAITKTKIPANQIEASELADNAVDTNAIADQAVALSKLPHGTSSNDGKFLRANNGADPTFETVTGTTINNNADNRVITGSGTANTLNGESGFIFDGTKLGIGMTPSSGTGYILQLESGQAQTFMTFGNTGTGNGALNGFVLGNDSTRAYITQRENQNINIATNNIDKMILESDGDLRLSSDNANSNYGFIDGWVASTGDMVIGADQSTTGSGGSNLIFRTRGGEKARILNSGGITFNGDTAAANALDDYEEGAFTIGFNGATQPSWHNKTATYVKIGQLVHIDMWLQASSTTSSTASIFFNLPYPASSTSNRPTSGVARVYGLRNWGSQRTAYGFMTAGSNLLNMMWVGTGSNPSNMNMNLWQNGAEIHVSISYRTN